MLIVTGCEKDNIGTTAKNKLDNIYSIEIEDIVYEESASEYIRKIKAASSQIDSILNFVNDVLSISEIKKLYDIWLNNGSYEHFVYDYSEIIIDGNTHFPPSIFDYYKSINNNN